MLRIFQYDNVSGKVELNVPEILLTKEFSELMNNERNITKEDPKGENKTRAYREFQYIYLALDWQSPYSDYTEQERHKEAINDSGLTEEEFNNPEFRAACRKFKNIQEQTLSIQLLNAVKTTCIRFKNYFLNVDPEERDELTGKPIYKVKDIITEVSSLSKVLNELQTLEGMVKKDISVKSSIRAGAVDGYIPSF